MKAGLQEVALPSVFGNPIFDDDAAALMVSAPINDMVGVTVAYTRGVDGSDNFDASGKDKDDLDMAFLAVPVTTDALDITLYFAYAWAGKNTAAPAGSGGVGSNFAINDDATAARVAGAASDPSHCAFRCAVRAWEVFLLGVAISISSF